MTASAEAGAPKPRTTLWLEGTLQGLLDPNIKTSFDKPPILEAARKQLEVFSGDEILAITKTGLNTLTGHKNVHIRNEVLYLMRSTLPLERVNPDVLATTYVESLTTIPADAPSDNVVAVVQAGTRLFRGIPKRESTFRQISSALDEVETSRNDAEIAEAIAVTRSTIIDAIVKYYLTDAEAHLHFVVEYVIRTGLRDPNITPDQIAKFGSRRPAKIDPILQYLLMRGFLESPQDRIWRRQYPPLKNWQIAALRMQEEHPSYSSDQIGRKLTVSGTTVASFFAKYNNQNDSE